MASRSTVSSLPSKGMSLENDVAFNMLDSAYRLGLINVTNVTIVVPIFAYLLYGLIPSHILFTAIGAQVVNVVVGFGGYGAWYFKKKSVNSAHFSRWQALFVFVITVGGGSWAVGPYLLIPIANGTELALLVGILLTVCAVIANTAAGQPWGMFGFLVAALGPVILVIWRMGDEVSRLLSLVLSAGLIIMILGGFKAARELRAQFTAQALLRVAAKEACDARELAESTSLAKSRFLANMSHELRSPLNAVIGAAQLLRAEGRDLESQSQLVDAIQRSGKNLLGLIENILDISRIEAGELHLSLGDFHLMDCADTAMATASLAAQSKGLALACIVDPGLQPWRFGDALRIRQILLNLLGNAIKFTTRGDVTLHIKPGVQENEVHISVTDSGVGIGAESLPTIFEPFRQAEDGANRRFGGSGLGLSIVQQLVLAMGGTITVKSQLGRGTCFDIDLILSPAQNLPEPPAPLGIPMAYFEPHEPSALGLDAQLKRLGCLGHRVSTAYELRHWLMTLALDKGTPWLLLACDNPLGVDVLAGGVDLLDPECVIGMTRGESQGGKELLNQLKLPHNIVKPVLRAELVSRLGRLRRILSGVPITVPAGLEMFDPLKAHAHVLVVEDDPLNQTIVCRLLSHGGYQTTAASDGRQALALMATQTFDLVLMDWQMPDMDGLEVTRLLRQGQSGALGKSIPIVALTANAFAEDRAACLAAGMNDFLTKPIQSELLMSTVQRWTGGETQAQDVPVYFHPPMTKVDTHPPAFDPTVLAALPMVADGSEPQYVQELLDMFTQSLVQMRQDIDQCLATEDTDTLCRVLHSLKSSSAMVGAMELAMLAEMHEHQLRQGQGPALELPRIVAQAVTRWHQAFPKNEDKDTADGGLA